MVMGGPSSTATCGRYGGRAAGPTTATATGGYHGYLALVDGGIGPEHHRLLLLLGLLMLFRLAQVFQLHPGRRRSRRSSKQRAAQVEQIEKKDERRKERKEMVYGTQENGVSPKTRSLTKRGRATVGLRIFPKI